MSQDYTESNQQSRPFIPSIFEDLYDLQMSNYENHSFDQDEVSMFGFRNITQELDELPKADLLNNYQAINQPPMASLLEIYQKESTGRYEQEAQFTQIKRQKLKIEAPKIQTKNRLQFKDLIRTAIIPKLKDFLFQTTKGLTVKRNRKTDVKNTKLPILILNDFEIQKIDQFIRSEKMNFCELQQLFGMKQYIGKKGTQYNRIRLHCYRIFQSLDFLMCCLNSSMSYTNKLGFLRNLQKIAGYALDPTTCFSYERSHGSQ